MANIWPQLGLLTAVVLASGVFACGGSTAHPSTNAAKIAHTSATSASESPLAEVKADGDRDGDIHALTHDNDNNSSEALNLGHPANASLRHTITALIKRYYAAALAEDGMSACSMIYSTLAESIPEDYSGNPGVPYMRGAKTCAAAMTLFFKHYHPLLALEVPTLKVLSIRIKQHHGIALLGFGALPERETYFSREAHSWKMTALLNQSVQ